MKALVIRQPWAELILAGHKTIEVRGYRTRLTDEFLIVADKATTLAGTQPLTYELGRPPAELDRGLAVGIARIYKVEAFHSPDQERQALLSWNGKDELWAWYLGNVRRVKPFPVRGMPGFFEVPAAEKA